MKDDHIDLLYAGGLALCALVGYLAFFAFRALKPAVIVLAALSLMAEGDAEAASVGHAGQGIWVVDVWLLVAAGHEATTVATFISEADCENTRRLLVARVKSAFYESRTACVPAKIVKTWGN